VAEGGLEYGFAPLLAADGEVEALLGGSRRPAAVA
jgi:hypothetical protein